jgi:hypothetical protein
MVQPLNKEVKKLWKGVQAYESYKKEKFTLRVDFLWLVHVFMAYGIFFVWSCHSILNFHMDTYARCLKLENIVSLVVEV